MSLLRATLRLGALVGLLLGGLVTVLVLFPMLTQYRRDRTMQQWSWLLVRSCGVRIAVEGDEGARLEQRSRGRMIVANHISWLDIFVINAVAPSCFIAKADIAAWPLVGTLVGRVGTLFLERGKRHAVHGMIVKAQTALRAGRRLAVFPEGTTGDGKGLMPFHANLIEAAVQAPAGVVPIGLRYRDSSGASQSGPDGPMHFVGDINFVQSVLRIVRARGVIAQVRPLAELHPDPSIAANKLRHALAASARTQLSQALALPLEDTIPETVRDLRAAQR